MYAAVDVVGSAAGCYGVDFAGCFAAGYFAAGYFAAGCFVACFAGNSEEYSERCSAVEHVAEDSVEDSVEDFVGDFVASFAVDSAAGGSAAEGPAAMIGGRLGIAVAEEGAVGVVGEAETPAPDPSSSGADGRSADGVAGHSALGSCARSPHGGRRTRGTHKAISGGRIAGSHADAAASADAGVHIAPCLHGET